MGIDAVIVRLIPPLLFTAMSGVHAAMFVVDGKPYSAGMAVSCGLLAIITTITGFSVKRA